MSTDREFADYLKSLPRLTTEDTVEERERLRDCLNGLWVGNQTGQHFYGEARH